MEKSAGQTSCSNNRSGSRSSSTLPRLFVSRPLRCQSLNKRLAVSGVTLAR
jgi:hypothetical protein